MVLLFMIIFNVVGMAQKGYEKSKEIADVYLEKNQWAKANEYYIRAYNKSNTAEVSYRIGFTYMKMYEYERAYKWYLIAEKKKYASLDFILNYAETLKSLKKYGVAKYKVNKSRLIPDSTKSYFVQGCDSAISWSMNRDYRTRVINLSSINTVHSEACPMFYKDDLVFSSNRENVIIKTTDGLNQEPYYGIYQSKRKGNHWIKPKKFFSSLNTINHETAVSFSHDEQKVYITRGTRSAYLERNDDQVNHMKLYQSEWKINKWSMPQYFILNDSSYSFGHPSFNDSSDVFVFASDMLGGYGGTDLYITFKGEKGWSKPLNLGQEINSAKDELYPYYLDDGTLYFSSNGHIGLGGFDIYKVNIKRPNTVLQNLKMPINSSYDDFSFIINKGLELAYFSSNRPKGKGGEDIYQVIFID